MAEKQTSLNDEMLEELYELLTLYFDIPIHGGVIRSGNCTDIEPQLDQVIFRERLLARITSVIVGGD